MPARMPATTNVRRSGSLLRCGSCPRIVGQLRTDEMGWVYAKLNSSRCQGCGTRLVINEEILEADTVARYA